MTFAPQAKARKTGWAQNALTKRDLQHDFHVTGVVQCVDTAQKITFTVTGRGVLPQVDLARDTFDFGACPVRHYFSLFFTCFHTLCQHMCVCDCTLIVH